MIVIAVVVSWFYIFKGCANIIFFSEEPSKRSEIRCSSLKMNRIGPVYKKKTRPKKTKETHG